ncbi:MAG: CD1375 family protein [Enterococcus faecium]
MKNGIFSVENVICNTRSEGKRTIESVPDILREDVAKIVDEAKKPEGTK